MDPSGRQYMMKDQYPTKNIIPPEAANTNPVTAGRIVGLPEGSLVHVNVNGNLIPVRTVAAPMTNVQTSVQDPAYTTTTVPFQITTSVIQAASAGGNPTPTIRILPPKIVRNQFAPLYNTVILPAKVVQTRLDPILPSPTQQLSIQALPVQITILPPSTPTAFSNQSITFPPNALQSLALPLRVLSVDRQPVTFPTQTLSVQAPIAASSVGKNIPFGTTTVPTNVPYGTAFAPHNFCL